MRPATFIFCICLAEILTMTPFATFPALLPFYFDAWQISGSEAGWVNGIFFLGFTIFGVFASTLTDRMDARHIVLFGLILAHIGAIGFAYLADGFVTSLPWRFISGAALACTYMPGLRLLTERLPEASQQRGIAFYTACFSTGSAVSFLLIGQIEKWWDAEAAVASAIFGPPIALLLTLLITGRKPHSAPRQWRELFNFAPVLGNTKAMGYVISYFCHSWELMAMRSFIVAYLAFAASQNQAPVWLDASVVATIVIFMGLPASVMGNELALKIGRSRAILLLMMSGFVLSLLLGFSSGFPFMVVAAIAILYGTFVTADSSSITSGAVMAAPNHMRGSTMAVHSFFGFLGAMLGPVVAGFMLELGGGHQVSFAWSLAFLSMGAVSLIGPFALRMTR